MSSFKSGFVTVVGSPNAGKSTLINTMVGQKISIVSERAQTTRNRIMGVLTRKDYQIVFIDTPGITTPKNKLGDYMLKVAYDSLNEVEAVLFLVDSTIGIGEKDLAIIKKLKSVKAPVIAVINKTDASSVDAVDTIIEALKGMDCFDEILKVLQNTATEYLSLKSISHHICPKGLCTTPRIWSRICRKGSYAASS